MIGSIYRDGVWHVAVGDTHIQSNERVIVVCMSQHLKDVQKLFLHSPKAAYSCGVFYKL